MISMLICLKRTRETLTLDHMKHYSGISGNTVYSIQFIQQLLLSFILQTMLSCFLRETDFHNKEHNRYPIIFSVFVEIQNDFKNCVELVNFHQEADLQGLDSCDFL